MKNHFTYFTFIFLLFLGVCAHAQVFWTETFGTNCLPRGNEASGYTGVNGAWSITFTGQNDSAGNTFYINDRDMFRGLGNCAGGNALACQPNPNNNLHLGGQAITLQQIFMSFPADSASYWTGFYCPYGYCNATHKRAESPVINCSGKSSIGISFNYYEGGDVNSQVDEDATLWYYDGSSWSLIHTLVKSNNTPCSGTSFGVPRSFAMSLPASANNNPNVKIGFAWDNDTISNGTDPSFAVDDITLTAGAAMPCAASFTIAADPNNLHTYIATNMATGALPISYDWTWGNGSHSASGFPSHTYADTGFYDICLSITDANGCADYYCDNSFHVVRTTNTMAYVNVVPGPSAVNEFGLDAEQVTIYPNPATDELVIAYPFAETLTATVCNVLGQQASARVELHRKGNHAALNITDLTPGLYFLELKGQSGSVGKRFVKQ